MNANTENNLRIAKNTIFLYIRMMLIMIVSLYTSRVILAELGVEDYGIYNVVGGIVMMFSFLNACMSSATQRFLTFELGKNNQGLVNDIFSASLNIHIILGIVIIVFAEVVGVWMINNKLIIPDERVFAANIVFQFSIFTFFINIVQVPYNAALIAHEKMSVYAYISIIEAVLKLSVAYLISIVTIDKLIVYAALICIVQMIIRGFYQIYCYKHYEECRFRFYYEKSIYKKLYSFAGWNLFGSIAWLLKDQGVNIILNIFFGPLINAARAVAIQVSSAAMNFISNFQVALNPQITKNYANGNIQKMEYLVYQGIKFSYFLLFILAFPICLNIDFILALWLKTVPSYSNYLIVLILIDALCGILFGVPLMTSLSATGNIKKYQIVVSSIIMLVVPISYFSLLIVPNIYLPFFVIIAITIISGVVRFYFCIRQIGFSVWRYMKKVLLPIIMVTFFTIPVPLFMKFLYFNDLSFKSFATLIVIPVLLICLFIWLFGIKEERKIIINYVKDKIDLKIR